MTETTYDWNAIKANYAPTATVHEWTTLQHIITTYELDIYTKEVWFIKTSGQARIFVSRDGHLAIAHRQGKFSMSTVFEFGDKPATNRKGKTIPIKAICTIRREGYPDAFVHEVYWDEYGSEMSLWGEKPKTMLQKVAECQCLRRAFDMHGFYAQEEFPDEMPTAAVAEVPQVSIHVPASAPVQPARAGTIWSENVPSDQWCSETEVETYLDNFKARGLDAEGLIAKATMDNGRIWKNKLQKEYEKAVQVAV